MNIENLVTMSNQIGMFFESMADRDQAVEDIAMHLKRFWAPPMRRQLLVHAQAAEKNEVRPIVMEALNKYSHLLG